MTELKTVSSFEEEREFKPMEEKKRDGEKYLVEIFDIEGNKSVKTDAYGIIAGCGVTNPALQHLIKKALFTGMRGHKNEIQDLEDVIESAIRAKQLAGS
jgi:hypothetical protein